MPYLRFYTASLPTLEKRRGHRDGQKQFRNAAHETGGGAGGSFAWSDELPGFSISAGGRFFCVSFIIAAMNIINLQADGQQGGRRRAESAVRRQRPTRAVERLAVQRDTGQATQRQPGAHEGEPGRTQRLCQDRG